MPTQDKFYTSWFTIIRLGRMKMCRITRVGEVHPFRLGVILVQLLVKVVNIQGLHSCFVVDYGDSNASVQPM